MGVFNRGKTPHPEATRKNRRWLRRILLAVCIVTALVCALALAVLWYFGTLANQFDLAKLGEMPQRSIVYDREGREIGRLHGENRIIISHGEIPGFFEKALIAREDSRFYRHEGVDMLGVIRAAVINTVSGELKQGASTITQQLARNSFPLGGQTLHRKIIEALVARRIEEKYSKEKIIELYVNRIYFGSGVFGLETAARAYFGKHAKDMTPGECAMLVGIIRSPNRFSPYRNLDGALGERNTVIDRMVDERMITKAESDAIRDASIRIAPKPPITKQDNYMMDCVRRELDVIIGGETYTGEGGLRIYTTLDASLQAASERAVDSHLTKMESRDGWPHPKRQDFVPTSSEPEHPTEYVQGAAVVIHNATGGVLAAVGGRDYLQSKVNRAFATQRQIGSAVKPFVYAAAFEKGLFPGMLISDDPIAPGEVASAATPWTPGNSDNRYNGLQPLEVGLIRSRNTMSVRIGEMAGLTEVRRVATLAGIAPWVPAQPSIYLGSFEASVKDVASAYSVFPNAGQRKQAYFIERVDDMDGQHVFLAAHIGLTAIEPGAAWLTHKCLESVVQRGTAARAADLGLTVKAGGKTGTTNDFRDAWFVGYTTSITCAVWVGMDLPEPIMSRGYGATLALPIWVDIINAAPTSRFPALDFAPPMPLQSVRVCGVSGKIAGPGCDAASTAYDIEIPESRIPTSVCTVHEGLVGSPMYVNEKERPSFFEKLFSGKRNKSKRPDRVVPPEPEWTDD